MDLDVEMQKISFVDINSNLYRVRGKLTQIWCDVRKKFNPKLGDYQIMNDDIAELALKMGKIWNPELRVLNAYEKRRSDNIRI